ncbi:hypothetical protein DB346_09440 [Verrucomicrobia bacterium LW23]|nr:hypothetical protein DB346_09440 [Verrucomicrobia bacterium LW23]
MTDRSLQAPATAATSTVAADDGPEEAARHILDAIEKRLGLSPCHSRRAEVLGAPGIRDKLDALLTAEPIPQEVVRQLTVGETYFNREPATLKVLETNVLPRIINARAQGPRVLRLWSAGCCTGEEALSLAMILDRLLPDVERWHVSIVATDVNRTFLDRAREGVFGEWSFRGTPPQLRTQYFSEAGPGLWRVAPRIARMVTYLEHNLAAPLLPRKITQGEAMDIVLCRNVLMYFSQRQSQAVLQRLRSVLRPESRSGRESALHEGGWMALSPTEYMMHRPSGFHVRTFDGVCLYQRADREAGSPPSRTFRGVTPQPRSATRSEPPRVAASPPVAIRQRPAHQQDARETVTGIGAAESLARARAEADSGRLESALHLCTQALDADKVNPGLHFLRARVLEELGRSDDAATALGRVLYLDPSFIPAYLAAGSLALRGGNRAHAVRHFKGALRLLQPLDPEGEVPGAEGLTAGHLTQMVLALQATAWPVLAQAPPAHFPA